MRNYVLMKTGLALLAAAVVFLCGGIAWAVQASDASADSLVGDSSDERVLRLESIEITGNNRTPEKIIRRYINIEPGDEIDVNRLDGARERLIATEYFSAVELSTRPGGERGKVVLIVAVSERSLLSFETGFGYDDLYGWFLTLLGLRMDNAFGIESRFRLGLRLGFRIAGVDAEWETPIPQSGGIGYSIRGHIYNQNHIFFGSSPSWQGSDWRRYTQDITRAGAEAALRYQVGRATRFSMGLHVESSEPDSTFTDSSEDEDFPPEDLPTALQDDLGKTLTTGAFFRVIRDTRDSDAYPLSGSFSLLTLQINDTFLGGDRIFTKVVGDVRKHISLGERTVWSSRMKVGAVTGDAPYYDRFYIGGNYTIRGFDEWSLSPAEGNDGFWLINTEIRTPLIGSHGPQPRLTGLFFFDAGQGWQRDESFSFRNVESAVGYGVRLGMPWLGTLGLDVGVPLSEGRTGDPFRIHLLLGFSY